MVRLIFAIVAVVVLLLIAKQLASKKTDSDYPYQKNVNLFSAGDLSVLCAVELDDQSHRRKSRQARDDFLARACGGAGLPLISFPARRDYVISDVSARIAEAVSVPRIHGFD